ncbi:hypothetical protein SESBI_23313 [Sesbania bispinosa]|nr:hypothetical protein SESBI_23313 [Sesbania bispinosa]
MATFPFGFSPRQERVTGSGGVRAPRNAFIGRGRARALHAPGSIRNDSTWTTFFIIRIPSANVATERRRARLIENEGQQTGSQVPKILLDIGSLLEEGKSGLLTPQKKLLNSIDKVEKVVREELQKLRRTPSANKAEREKRVRTIMSMR